MTSKRRASFKFQSDSINTLLNTDAEDELCPLNSNLILLIPLPSMHRHRPLTIFKFQSDSINTAERKKKVRINNHFKFQSDSINTESGCNVQLRMAAL